MKVGDRFDVGIINGPVGKATINRLDSSLMEVSVEWGAVPPLPPPIYLLIGLCRPATVRKILGTVPTLGARQVLFCPTHRTDPAYSRSSLWTSGEWRDRVVEGVEQAFDTHVPGVSLGESMQQSLQKLPSGGLRLALDVYEGLFPLSSVTIPEGAPVCLAVGPERGWDARDRDWLRENGFQLVSLHDRVLRVETAVVVGLTLLLQKMGQL